MTTIRGAGGKTRICPVSPYSRHTWPRIGPLGHAGVGRLDPRRRERPRQGQLGHREPDGEEQDECLDLVGVADFEDAVRLGG
jgi:hypothetical protein